MAADGDLALKGRAGHLKVQAAMRAFEAPILGSPSSSATPR
jgi:hypothetical protein